MAYRAGLRHFSPIAPYSSPKKYRVIIHRLRGRSRVTGLRYCFKYSVSFCLFNICTFHPYMTTMFEKGGIFRFNVSRGPVRNR